MIYLEDVSRTQLVDTINEYIIGKHAERDRQIIYRRLVDGIIYEALAEEFDLSVRQTKEIVYKCEKKIFKHLPG